MNPTDFTDVNPFGEYSLGAQVGFSGQFLNFIYGKQGFNETIVGGTVVDTDIKGLFQIDYTGGFDITDAFYLGINATYQDTDGVGFYGAAIYPQYTTSDTFTIGLRAEFFKEQGDYGAIGTGVEDSDVFAITLSGNVTVGEYLTFIPELRLDSASDDAFINNDLEPSDSLASFLVAAVFAF